ncbi:hypothetical protein BDU57DRAFT_534299 [Ampelomyces quisqualis]|uniref:Uncharacterized protein n=1 Tax=Ampelomyces quisqualis TaxID=50730 RepID=A0A6A5R0R0_AMPQU|nr:hypothetical protein BDU57DRAFT_534299 [Ampelomyces quisqualis]
MHLQTYLWGVLLWQPVLSLGIPKISGQSPLLPVRPQTTEPSGNSVILAYKESGSDRVRHFEIALRRLTLSGVDIPAQPNEIRIASVVNRKGGLAPLEELSKVMCRIVPKLSVEEKTALEFSGQEKLFPWFRTDDETIFFKRPSSRWFLAGRSIQSYECR